MKKKILLVTGVLLKGGSEKNIRYLLDHLDRDRYDPVLVLLEDGIAFEIPYDVPVVSLGKKKRLDFFKLILKLFHLIKKEKPQVVIGFLIYPNVILLLAKWISRLKCRTIISVRNNPEKSVLDTGFPRLFRFFLRRLYPKSDCIICVSKGVGENLSRRFSVPESKIRIVYNAVAIDEIKGLAKQKADFQWIQDSHVPIIISVGRLSKQKAQWDLIKSFAILRKELMARLVLIGGGGKDKELRALAEQEGISNDVAFMGFQKNPYSFISRSRVFVLSSHWEGMPNVLLEAMACGVPVVSSNCHYGPNEIIQDGMNGFLFPVGDIGSMAAILLKVLNDGSLRKKLILGGMRRVKEFGVKKMVSEYERILEGR